MSDGIRKDIIIFGPAPNKNSSLSLSNSLNPINRNIECRCIAIRLRSDERHATLWGIGFVSRRVQIWIGVIGRWFCWKPFPIIVAAHFNGRSGSAILPLGHYSDDVPEWLNFKGPNKNKGPLRGAGIFNLLRENFFLSISVPSQHSCQNCDGDGCGSGRGSVVLVKLYNQPFDRPPHKPAKRTIDKPLSVLSVTLITLFSYFMLAWGGGKILV